MSCTILYIEDDPTHARLVRKALTFRGFNVLESANGLQGIAVAARENPDIILLDMHLPDISGMDVISRIRGDHTIGHITVVAVTASTDDGLREHALSHGCDGFIRKPLDTRTLSESLQSYVEQPVTLPSGIEQRS